LLGIKKIKQPIHTPPLLFHLDDLDTFDSSIQKQINSEFIKVKCDLLCKLSILGNSPFMKDCIELIQTKRNTFFLCFF